MPRSEKPSEEYSTKSCITAGELREQGIEIEEHIPDCAWMSREGVRYGELEVSQDDDHTFHYTQVVYFDKPLRWLTLRVEIDKEKDQK